MLGRRLQQIGLKVEVVLLGELLYPGKRAFYHLHNGRYLDTGVGAEDRDRLPPLLVGDAGDDFNDKGAKNFHLAATDLGLGAPARTRPISVLDRIGDSCFNNRHYGND